MRRRRKELLARRAIAGTLTAANGTFPQSGNDNGNNTITLTR